MYSEGIKVVQLFVTVKKQGGNVMLRQNRIPKAVRLIGVLWAVVMIASLFTSAMAANTTHNRIDYDWGTTVSSSYTTPAVPKGTDSNCFVANYTASSTDFKKIYVYGRNHAGSYTNCTLGSPRICYKGGTTPLPNRVGRDGYPDAALTISYDANPHVILKGYWIADT